MVRSRVLVMAAPYVYATALADRLRHDGYDVVVPDLSAGETAPPSDWDAVLTAAAVTAGAVAGDVPCDVVVTLPAWSYDDPVVVTIGGVSEAVVVDPGDPIGDVMTLLGRSVDHARRRAQPSP
jgi:hypothetical protein